MLIYPFLQCKLIDLHLGEVLDGLDGRQLNDVD